MKIDAVKRIRESTCVQITGAPPKDIPYPEKDQGWHLCGVVSVGCAIHYCEHFFYFERTVLVAEDIDTGELSNVRRPEV